MLHAVQHVRRMRGGAQGHLMRADDEQYYVVKFQNNPQHVRVLANELLATRIAARLGLPVPVVEVVGVGEWLIAHTPELRIELAGQSLRCAAGLQFGARFVVDPFAGQVFDYLPQAMLPRVRNLETFAGVLAFDKWTCNANGRQAVYWRRPREQKYTASFVDQATASTPASGASRMRRCAACTAGTTFTPRSPDGIRSSPGCGASRSFRRPTSTPAPPISPRSGAWDGTNWSGCASGCWRGAHACEN